jgi:hypothetical protein
LTRVTDLTGSVSLLVQDGLAHHRQVAGDSHAAARRNYAGTSPITLRQLGNRLVGILHGCLKTGTSYDETTAWGHRESTLDNKNLGWLPMGGHVFLSAR